MLTDYTVDLLTRIYRARESAATYFCSLKTDNGFKYTTTHDTAKYPVATLYGTWAAILGLNLLGETCLWTEAQKEWAVEKLNVHRRADGSFLGVGLEDKRNSKSHEYLILHSTNYSSGAALELYDNFDFQNAYFHRFLDGDALSAWLNARSFERPWEESNNIVNVASYLALCYEHAVPNASDRLCQLLEWHRRYQNPKTGGFDCFNNPSFNQRSQSLAGAVHNFHLYHYMNEPLQYEQVIADSLLRYLFGGRLTACLSIDFVELAIRTLNHSPEPQRTIWALLDHADALLRSQREDGGWLEAATNDQPTQAAGFADKVPSSCSYATWFRLCSLGMIAIVLLGDSPEKWRFRKTLGMGYAPPNWPVLPHEVILEPLPPHERAKNALSLLPWKSRSAALNLAKKVLLH